MTTNEQAWKLYSRYVDGWKAISAEERRRIVEESLAADLSYITPNHAAGSRETAIADMVAFQTKFPGGRFDIGDVSAHHDVALLTWILVTSDGTAGAKGHDQIRVRNGRIVELVTYAPSVSR